MVLLQYDLAKKFWKFKVNKAAKAYISIHYICFTSVNTVNENTDQNYMSCNIEACFKMNMKILPFNLYPILQLEHLMFIL